MLKKSFVALAVLSLMVLFTGCGGDDQKKAATEKPAYSADKAVLAYAEMYAFGVTDHLSEAGLTEKDIEQISDNIVGEFVQSFAQFPLNEENVAAMTTSYLAKLMLAMDIKTTLKTDDPENPVVTLTATTVNEAEAAKMAETNPDILGLGVALGQLQSEGHTLDQLKNNPEFQKAAMECIDNFINEIPLNPEKSIDVPCEKAQGSDGKVYWAPKDPAAVMNFVHNK
ncbi:MAG: DUF5105 domain-containing protein [Selenomonadaceae bacterium]|nr:DUF5105 domain-containing protein [Selenomonadaceae bacterium]